MEEYFKVVNQLGTWKPKNILEVGSRDGHDAAALARLFDIPHNKTFVVEANPYCADNIRKTYPDFRLHEVAISNKNGVAEFYAIDPSLGDMMLGQSSIVEKVNGQYNGISEKIQVHTITGYRLLNIINEESIDICKIDVEGHTFEVIDSFGDKIKNLMSIHLEAEHKEIWKGQRLYDEICHLLVSRGFRCVYFATRDSVQSDSIFVLKELGVR